MIKPLLPEDVLALVADVPPDDQNLYPVLARRLLRLRLRAGTGNRVLCTDPKVDFTDVTVAFTDGAFDSTVVIGPGTTGPLKIIVSGRSSVIYVGNECKLRDLEIRSVQNEDLVVVGNQVTTTSTNRWISGRGARALRPRLIVGDDCMFSYGVTIRNSDGHPVYDALSDTPINEPDADVVLEPHVWIGQDAMILKGARLGACAVVASGSMVTGSVPRACVVGGVPARVLRTAPVYWARNSTEAARLEARRYYDHYCATPAEPASAEDQPLTLQG